jgi:toxin ParE1/3/4
MKYEFHPAALPEYAEAVQFFEQDKHQDFIDTIALGAGFANENAIFKIIDSPERWPIVEGQFRRCLTLKFSYAILIIAFIPIES